MQLSQIHGFSRLSWEWLDNRLASTNVLALETTVQNRHNIGHGSPWQFWKARRATRLEVQQKLQAEGNGD